MFFLPTTFPRLQSNDTPKGSVTLYCGNQTDILLNLSSYPPHNRSVNALRTLRSSSASLHLRTDVLRQTVATTVLQRTERACGIVPYLFALGCVLRLEDRSCPSSRLLIMIGERRCRSPIILCCYAASPLELDRDSGEVASSTNSRRDTAGRACLRAAMPFSFSRIVDGAYCCWRYC